MRKGEQREQKRQPALEETFREKIKILGHYAFNSRQRLFE